MEKDTENQARPTLAGEVKQEVKAHLFHNAGFLGIDYFTLFWIFVAGCVFGLVVETVFHAIVYGGYESRAGLVWGPFSPIYGTGAVVLTVSLNRFYHSHNLVIFLVAMVVGSVLEYVTSWGMEFFWGAVAWNYSGTFGSINGRTNFAFGMMWGLLGLVWVRVALHLLLLIPIVGVTYEFNRYVGGHDNKVTRFLARPGLWLQNFTTNEPDDSMLEVAIRALELVIPEEKGKDAW